MHEVLVFQHDPFEDLGFFAEVLEKQGANFRTIRLFHGEMPAEKPLTADRGPDEMMAASTNHEATRPTYSERRSRHAARQLSARNARS